MREPNVGTSGTFTRPPEWPCIRRHFSSNALLARSGSTALVRKADLWITVRIVSPSDQPRPLATSVDRPARSSLNAFVQKITLGNSRRSRGAGSSLHARRCVQLNQGARLLLDVDHEACVAAQGAAVLLPDAGRNGHRFQLESLAHHTRRFRSSPRRGRRQTDVTFPQAGEA